MYVSLHIVTLRRIILMALLAVLTLETAAQRLPRRRDNLGIGTYLKKPLGEIDFFSAKPDTLSLFFLGDVMSHGAMMRSAFSEYRKSHPDARSDRHECYDYSSFFNRLENQIASADIAFCNMEFPLAGPPFTGYPSFSGPDSYLDYLEKTGFDVILLANNHILDKGDMGLERTIKECDKLENRTEARYTGVFSSSEDRDYRYPLIVESRGVRLGIINFTYGTNSGSQKALPGVNRTSREEIRAAIRKAKERDCDIIIAIPHWGNEYQMTHSSYQEDLARFMAKEGVDIIVGAHPHVAQDIMTIKTSDKDVPVVYSLGNAVSNQNDLIARLELSLTVKIALHRNGNLEMLPLEPEFLWCTKPGTVDDSYCVVRVKEEEGRRNDWRVPSDHDKMMATYEIVKKATHIN